MTAANLTSTIKEDAKKWAKEALVEEIDSILHFTTNANYASVRLRSLNGKQVLLTYDSKTGTRMPPPIVIPQEFLTSSEEVLRKLARDKFGLNPLNY